MKKILILIIIAAIFTNCEDLLDKEPLGSLDVSTYYSNAEEAVYAVNSCYDAIQTGWIYGSQMIIEDIQSDDANKGGGGASDQPGMDALQKFIAASDNHIFSDKWNAYYKAIFRCNLVLEKVPEITEENIDDALKARVLGEAQFIRALCYFDLVRRYGGVPIVTRPNHPDDLEIARNSEAEVWQFIEQDLTDAMTGLTMPSALGASDKGRATKGAAHALLAKAYVYQQKWSEANDALTSVINNYGYALLDNFSDNFDIGNDHNIEAIFQIQFQTKGASDYEGYNKNGWMAPRTNDVPWGGIGFMLPTQSIVDEFEEGDPRLEESILREGDVFDGDTYQSAWSPTGFNCRKGLVPFSEFTVGHGWFVDNNIPILRLADMLLLKAESLNELNKTTEAEAFINQVRQRVGMPALSGLSKSEMTAAIIHERRVELCFEQQRFFDLVRWGIVGTTMRAAGKNFNDNKNELWAIPQSEIDINENLNQNQGY